MAEPRLVLVGSSDEFLAQEALDEEIAAVQQVMGEAAVMELDPAISPARVAEEVVSGSLFDPRRILVIRDVGSWLDAPAPVGGSGRTLPVNPAPLVRTLERGLPEDVALVMGAWCGARPRGPLVELAASAGRFRWIPLPAPPKPWEDAPVSAEEAQALRDILARHVPGLRLSPPAEELLFARLGFAPRQLIAEATKLATAAGAGGTVDEELVRQLCFPRERSLDAVRESVLARDPAPLADLIEAMEGGIPVRDWQGRPVEASGVPFIVVAQVTALVADLLVLRRLLVAGGKGGELDPRRVGDRSWYTRRFKNGLGPWLLERLDGATWGRRRKKPSLWALGNMVKGAARYRDRELVAALAGSGTVEERLRGRLAVEALSAWLLGLVGPRS